MQLDTIYDFDRVNPNWTATLRPSKIPVNCPGDPGCGNDGETILSVRQSRLGFRGFVPTELGELRTIFEFDLFGVGADEGQTTIRLRHAWGELGQFGAGQTNSLFMDGDVFPNTIDYWGPSAWCSCAPRRYAGRRGRRELAGGDRDRVAGLGLRPGQGGPRDPRARSSAGLEQLPDLTGQVRYSDDWGHVQLAAILRGLGVEGTTPPTPSSRTVASTGRATSAGA